ncbi:MAG: DUF4118 domain-containing protein [Candidatus Margulisiibacteriota bacterium]|jgi:two-component system sensor histidine kinase KdpD
MNPDNRPNPDQLLKKILQDEAAEQKKIQKGRLKIFLGYSAGVGKTYKMLKEAQFYAKNNTNVYVGLVETHGRKETEALLTGLKIIPRKKIDYAGITLEEMDLDAVLLKFSVATGSLVIVDELAHTNVPGSRHAKRYQDIEELLDNGIDVFTTFNIQHVESLVDIIYEISNIEIKETVPDSILELANEIELVDISPEKLLERLGEGKVYIPEKAKQAMQEFFRKGNLLALRELALRYTAKKVDADMTTYKSENAIVTPWPVGSRLLVAISSSPNSERLLRVTHRMASDMDAEWFVVYVDSPQIVKNFDQAKNQLEKNIRLAKDLGAKVEVLSGSVIADEIINFALDKNVSLIIAGLSHRSLFQKLFKGTVLDELLKRKLSINTLIVGDESNLNKHAIKFEILRRKDYKAYLFGFLGLALMVVIAKFFSNWLDPVSTGMLLILPVIFSGILWGNRAALATSFCAILAFNYFFIPPFYGFQIADFKHLPTYLIFIVISLVISFLSKFARTQTENAQYRIKFLTALNEFSREIMKAKNQDEIIDKTVNYMAEAFVSDVVIFLADNSGNLELCAKNITGISLTQADNAVAVWAYKHNQVAGKSTNTLASNSWYFYPISIKDLPLGVVGIYKKDKFLTSEQLQLFESFVGMIGLLLKK